MTAPSNADGAALAHRPWAYVGGAAAGHGEGSWGVLRDAAKKPRARRWWGRPSAWSGFGALVAVGEWARCGSATRDRGPREGLGRDLVVNLTTPEYIRGEQY